MCGACMTSAPVLQGSVSIGGGHLRRTFASPLKWTGLSFERSMPN